MEGLWRLEGVNISKGQVRAEGMERSHVAAENIREQWRMLGMNFYVTWLTCLPVMWVWGMNPPTRTPTPAKPISLPWGFPYLCHSLWVKAIAWVIVQCDGEPCASQAYTF